MSKAFQLRREQINFTRIPNISSGRVLTHIWTEKTQTEI